MKRAVDQLKRLGAATLCAATLLGALSTSSASASPNSSNSSTSATTYTVKSGDSLSGIAAKVGVSLTDLLSANGFQKTSVIHSGQIIKLPASAKVSTSATVASASTSTSTSTSVSTSSTSSRVQKIIDFAKSQVGKPYRYGAAGPDAYDCSGLVRAAFKQAGLNVPHSSRQLSVLGTEVDWKRNGIRAGDLVFTFSSSTPGQIGHVGIAISSTQWVESPFSGGAVRVANLPSAAKIQAVRRLA